VAETFMGRFGFGFMAVGAVVAAVSAINADIFGSTRLIGMLAEEGPHRWKRAGTVFGGHPWKLVFLTTAGVIATTTMNLHALSAVSSAGFLMVFAAVNTANARLAKETKSRRWVSLVAAMTCLAALGAMLVQLGGQDARRHEAVIIVAMAVLPFVLRPIDAAVRSMAAARVRSRRRPGLLLLVLHRLLHLLASPSTVRPSARPSGRYPSHPSRS
jgi:L-asparagine transporter-like permease